VIAQAVNPVRNTSGALFLNGVKLMNFLKGPKLFIIPIYQRTYSWTRKECWQLSQMDDPKGICKDVTKYWFALRKARGGEFSFMQRNIQ